MRVGIVGFMHESCTFVDGPTVHEDFVRDVIVAGSAMGDFFRSGHHEITGFMRGLEEAGIEPLPLYFARANPWGPITDACWRPLIQDLLRAVAQAGKLDGLLVAPHGAAVGETEPDLDGYWLTELRKQVGPDLPVINTLDLHANLTPRMIAASNATIPYRENPHLDQLARGLQAARLMADTLQGRVQPTQAAAFPRFIINIERQRTAEPHCRALYEHLLAQEGRVGVLASGVTLGFPYADVPEMGSAFIVVTNDNPAQAQQLANESAQWLAQRQADFTGVMIDPATAVKQSVSSAKPVCLLDMGDNVGGGSAADGTFIAHAFHQRKLAGVRCFVAINDPAVAQQAQQAGVGGVIDAAVGGKLDDQHGAPLQARFTVVSLHDGKYSEKLPRHGGRTTYDMGLTAILSTDTGLTVQVTSVRTPPFSLQQLLSCHIDPAAHKLLVAKGVNAPVAAYAPVCGERMIRVNTAGVTTADMAKLNYQHRRRPLYPLEAIPAR